MHCNFGLGHSSYYHKTKAKAIAVCGCLRTIDTVGTVSSGHRAAYHTLLPYLMVD